MALQDPPRGGPRRLHAAALLTVLLAAAAAPAAATYYKQNPKCRDGSKPRCGSTPIRTDCCEAENVRNRFSSFYKRYDCDKASWSKSSCGRSSGDVGFTSYGFLQLDEDDDVDFQLETYGGSALVQFDDDDQFMSSGAHRRMLALSVASVQWLPRVSVLVSLRIAQTLEAGMRSSAPAPRCACHPCGRHCPKC